MEVCDDVARGIPHDAGSGALRHLLHVHREKVLRGQEGVDEHHRGDVFPKEPAVEISKPQTSRMERGCQSPNSVQFVGSQLRIRC